MRIERLSFFCSAVNNPSIDVGVVLLSKSKMMIKHIHKPKKVFFTHRDFMKTISIS